MNGALMMKKIYLETFGCQMNVLDSELVMGQLAALGYEFTPDLDAAGIVLYNTCSVREHSENKVRSRLGLLKTRKAADPELVIGVIGCMAERGGAGMLKRLPHVDLLCGPGELDKLPTLLDNVFRTGRQQAALAGNTSRRSATLGAAEEDGLELLDLSRSFSASESRYQAYVRVVRGCNKFCTYCVVPHTRGPEVSRPPESIIEEARRLVAAGALEITLLGQTVNHYHFEHAPASGPGGPMKRRTSFAQLLERLHESLPELPRLRFITSFPADFGDDILQVMAGCNRICKYLHIPAQSGSNRILKMMNRGYRVEEYQGLLERARRMVPGIALAGDMIVGFPTETEEDYQLSAKLVAESRYKNCFIFKYSPRPGTLAIRRYPDDVPDEVKRDRNNHLLHIQNAICEELNRELIGQTLPVLCQGPSGWVRPADSIVAGAGPGRMRVPEFGAATTGGEVGVQFGPRMAAAMRGRVEVPVAARPVEQTRGFSDSVQLTGRTGADQIVVFPGLPEWEGQIVDVHIDEAHAMTIFGHAVTDAAVASS